MPHPDDFSIPIHPRPQAISLYAGVGGLDLGMEAAGLKIALAIEKDPQTAAQYGVNFPNTPVLCSDITQLTAAEITSHIGNKNPIDLIIGGPSCQGFSRIGKRNPQDTRNSGIHHFVRLIKELHPRAFLMENVAGMRDERHAELVNHCWQQLLSHGYQIQEWRLNAADYRVPQSRERLFWVGCLDTSISVPQPAKDKITVWDALFDLKPLEALLDLNQDIVETNWQPGEYSQYLNNIFTPPTNWHPQQLTGCTLTDHSPEVITRFITTPYGEIEPISRLYRLDYQTQSHTLRAGTDSERGRHTAPRPIHPEYPRVITVREAARLSSFPDWFQFSPTKWRGHRQIGNAVPPLLALAVGRQILNALANSINNFQAIPAKTTNHLNQNSDFSTFSENSTNIRSNIMSSTTISPLKNYQFPPETSSQTIALAKEVVELGSSHTATLSKLKEQSLELGYKLLELETALGESELKELLKHCFPKEIVRYYRNILAQAKLIEKCPQLYDKILNMPICHAAALLAGTEAQIEQILNEDAKWTISLIKQRVKAENTCPPSIPEIAIGKPVKILASDSEHSGNIALVQNIQDEEIISVQLLSGELQEFFPNEVKPIDPDTYQELNTILSTSLNLHDQFKTAANQGDESLTNEIENKLTKLDKCRRQLSTRLGLSDKAVNNLSNAIANNHTELSQTIVSETECDRAYQVWNIAENEREPIIAKAQLLAKLRTHEVDAQPTTGEMAIAIASYLHKSNTKHNGGGIPITTREYSELTELIQQQNATIRQLKAELDLLRKEKSSPAAATVKADDNKTEELNQLRQDIQTLRQTYESLQQMHAAANAQLAESQQLAREKTALLDEFKTTKSNSNSDSSTTNITRTNNIEIGARIIVINHDMWTGYAGEIVGKWEREPDSWWVLLDHLVAQGLTHKTLVKTSNIILEIPEHEPLRKELSNFEQTIIKQRQELQEYQQTVADKEQQQEKEIETIASEFGTLAQLLGWFGWSTRGDYRSTDGQKYTGLEAFKAFINDMGNASVPDAMEEDIEF
ncbi:MAG TPA: DNA (cytosine-5-)-methyltransferase [Leptolyngbyaceae cyanobacterium]